MSGKKAVKKSAVKSSGVGQKKAVNKPATKAQPADGQAKGAKTWKGK